VVLLDLVGRGCKVVHWLFDKLPKEGLQEIQDFLGFLHDLVLQVFLVGLFDQVHQGGSIHKRSQFLF
jgi:hypothetical protein